MVEFKTKIYYENKDSKGKDNIIGAEVTVYSSEGDDIGSIQITSKKDFDDLMEKLNGIDDTYVKNENLSSEVSKLQINAVTVGGKSTTDFALSNHTHDERYFTETEINNKLLWKSLEGLPTNVELYYNDLFCCLELSDFVKKNVPTTQNWVNLGIVIPNEYLPKSDASGNVHNSNAQIVVFRDNGTNVSRVQLKRFNGNFTESTQTINASAVWRRK